MGLLKRKSKVNIEQLCQQYYESQIFEKIEGGKYLSVEFFNHAVANLILADKSATKIDTLLFIKELIALNIELFGLAWWHHNFEIADKDKKHQFLENICSEILFTQSYLMQNGLQDIWDTMGFYNKSMFNAKGKWILWGGWARLRDIPSIVREDAREDWAIETSRQQLKSYEKILVKEEFKRLDSSCYKRLIYRSFIALEWQEGVMLSQELTQALISRLNHKLNNEALFILQSIILGLYDNAIGYIKAVKEYGSYEAYKTHLMGIKKLIAEKLRSNQNNSIH